MPYLRAVVGSVGGDCGSEPIVDDQCAYPLGDRRVVFDPVGVAFPESDCLDHMAIEVALHLLVLDKARSDTEGLHALLAQVRAIQLLGESGHRHVGLQLHPKQRGRWCGWSRGRLGRRGAAGREGHECRYDDVTEFHNLPLLGVLRTDNILTYNSKVNLCY